jgi:hypothetical protein
MVEGRDGWGEKLQDIVAGRRYAVLIAGRCDLSCAAVNSVAARSCLMSTANESCGVNQTGRVKV